MLCFNPHRPVKAGATYVSVAAMLSPGDLSFNPHRPVKAGATDALVAIPATLLSMLMFQSSPAGKAGATGMRLHNIMSAFRKFQSSPAGEGRCYQHAQYRQRLGCAVSILTGR